MLIVVPDISGFTKFMSDSNPDMNTRVIPSLLNKIIYSNTIGLEVSEIEGDAVLFYKTGELPPFRDLIDQCIVFYKEFHKQLVKLEIRFDNHKDNKKITDILGLKIILHCGEGVELVQIGKHIKLMGEDVVIAHKLMKNSVPSNEYLLLSESLLNHYDIDEVDRKLYWGDSVDSRTFYEHLGKVRYTYIDLTPLDKSIPS
jgi:hypothetical protein